MRVHHLTKMLSRNHCLDLGFHRAFLFFCSHSSFGGLEANSGMSAVAEWFVHRSAAATQRNRHLSADVVRLAVCVGECELAQVSRNQIRTVPLWGDIDWHEGSSRVYTDETQ